MQLSKLELTGLTLAVIVGLAGCAAATRRSQPALHEDDAIIYAIVLDSLFKHPTLAPRTSITVLATTATYVRDSLVPEFWKSLYDTPGVDSTEVADFERRARVPISLVAELGTLNGRSGWHIELVSAAALHDLTRGDTTADGRPLCCADVFWSEFYRRFPGSVGTVSLSPVGYDPARNAAVLMIDHGCGALCGTGRVVALRRLAGAWHIVGIRQTWIS